MRTIRVYKAREENEKHKQQEDLPNHDSATRSGAFIRHHIKLRVNIHGTGGGELGDLTVLALRENFTHRHERLLKGQVRRRIVVVLVQDFQHGTRASATGAARRVG